jgi:multidrug efflux pump subunit AcrA (membrane-fusion protein)
MTKKQSLLTFFAIIVIGGASVLIGVSLSKQKQPMTRRPSPVQNAPLEIVSVQNESIKMSITLTGHLYALDKVELYAEVQGILLPTEKRFKEGNHFARGEILVLIDDSVFRNNLLAQKSSLLNQLTLLLPDLSIDFPDSARAWEQYLNAFDLEKPLQALPKPKSEKERYYIAARNIFNLYYTIKSMEATHVKYRLQAPYDGVVTQSNINPGTLVRPGQKLGEFTSTAIYEMEAFAGMDDLPYLDVGEKVTLICDDIPGQFEGRIQRISEIIDKASQSMKVYITTKSRKLKEGMYITAILKSEPIKNAFKLPRSALVGTNQLWVIQNGSLILKTITIAGDDEDNLIVQGLADGTRVITDPPSEAHEGMAIPAEAGQKPLQAGKVSPQ